MIKVIDPHIHLFDLDAGNYQWLKPENPPFWPDKSIIEQNFTEQDIALLAPLSLSGFVHIEAGFDNEKPWREVERLEQHCQLPFKSVAYIDICQPTNDFDKALKKLMAYQSLAGVRDILDDEAVKKLNTKEAQVNLSTLAKNSLSFDCQFNASCDKSAKALTNTLSKLVNLQVIINHAGFPPIDLNEYKTWLSNMSTLAKFENVNVKCSGFEMIERDYKSSWVHQVLNDVINVFGDNKVMLASNFPLALFSKPYQSYWQELLENLPFTDEQVDKLTFANSHRIYKF